MATVFNHYSEDYDKWFDTPEGKVLFRMEVEAVRLLTRNIEKPSLEIGVGTGRFAISQPFPYLYKSLSL